MSSVVKILQPSGILDSVKTNELRRDVSEVLADGANVILLDFQEVTFMNSSGLGTLVAILKNVRSEGGKLYICSLSDQVKIIFSLTKMDKIFKVFASRDDFEAQLSSSPAG